MTIDNVLCDTGFTKLYNLGATGSAQANDLEFNEINPSLVMLLANWDELPIWTRAKKQKKEYSSNSCAAEKREVKLWEHVGRSIAFLLLLRSFVLPLGGTSTSAFVVLSVSPWFRIVKEQRC